MNQIPSNRIVDVTYIAPDFWRMYCNHGSPPIPLMFTEARLRDPSEAAVAAKRIAVHHGEKLPDECAGMISGFLTSA